MKRSVAYLRAHPPLDQTGVLGPCRKCDKPTFVHFGDPVVCDDHDETEDGIRGGQGRSAMDTVRNSRLLGFLAGLVVACAVLYALFVGINLLAGVPLWPLN